MGYEKSRIGRAFDIVLALLLLAMLITSSLTPVAYAMDTKKCTARPNTDTGSDVRGGVETRVTWEGQAAEDESLTAVTLVFPEGTSITDKDASVTVLSGEDLMTREKPEATFSVDGDTFKVEFVEPIEAGRFLRVEAYHVVFPAGGGEMVMSGTYTLANGSTLPMPDLPSIQVTVTSPTEQLASYLEQQEWVQAWNSNTFLKLFFNIPILIRSIPIVFQGFLMALAIVFVAFPLAIPIGLAFSFMRMSKIKILRAIGALYVNVVRGTPVFLQIYIAFFGLPLAGIQIPPFILGVLVLALNSSAYQCEIFRAGIQSISKGQFEAARSLGMTGAQTMLFVIIPQTVRRVLPTMTSEFILLYKDTSMLAAVAVMEIVMYAKNIVATTGSITPYIVAALFYLVLTIPLASLVGKLEERLAGGSNQSKKAAKKQKKQALKEAKQAMNPGVVAEKLEESPDVEAPDISISPERFSSM